MKHHLKAMLSVIVMTLAMQTTINAATNTQEVENFVSRFYTEVLGRTADTAGLADWTNRLVSGDSAGSDVATGFVFSDEFINRQTDDTTFLNILYRAFFNRTADAGGLNGWLSELGQGTTRENVLNGFLFSTEFDNLCKSYGIKTVPDGASPSTGGGVEEFVKRFYTVVLGREADVGGLTDWINRLNTKVATGADIATGFVFSDEFDEASKDDVSFLNVLYQAFFNRAADAGGLNGWLSQLEQGTSREDVLNGFLHSDEFVNLCSSYGILAYIIPESGLNDLFVGKTYYMNEDGTVTTLAFGTNGQLLLSGVDGNGNAIEIIFTYQIVGDTMHISGGEEDSVLSNFQVVDKGISYFTADGYNGGFYFTYADAQADVYNDTNGNTNTTQYTVDNTLSATVNLVGNTLTVVFNQDMQSGYSTTGDYSPISSTWTDARTFVIEFSDYIAGGTITLVADGFVTVSDTIMASDVVFTFPG